MLRFCAVAVLLLGCSSPVVVVDVQNPQGLNVAQEHVTAEWTSSDGRTRSATHDFAVNNGSIGNFYILLDDARDGRMRITADLDDAAGTRVGRASGTVPLTGASRIDLTLRATRLLAGSGLAVVAGLPGGAGDRDGLSGVGSTETARIDHPVAFTRLGFNHLDGNGGSFVLEQCGRIRHFYSNGPNQLATFVPCSRHQPAMTSGMLADLGIDDPTAMVGDPYEARLFVGDGHRVIAIDITSASPDPASTGYVDFTAAAGLSPQHVADLALGPYEPTDDNLNPAYTTLYVADDVANVVWAYPLAGGAPTAVIGKPGPCMKPLPAGEQPAPSSPWSPGPWLAPDQVHLCKPTRVDVGALNGSTGDPVVFVGEAGNGMVRMLAPNGLSAGTPGVTTLFGGVASLRSLMYRPLADGVAVPGELGALFYFDGNRLGLFGLYSAGASFPVGQPVPVSAVDAPGYTESFDLRGAILSGLAGAPAQISFDDPIHMYRMRDRVSDPVNLNTLFDIVQRGNSVVTKVALDLTGEQWVGVGAHRGHDLAGAGQAAFAAPIGMAWAGGALFVADRDNDAVAQVSYDGTQRPPATTGVAPLGGDVVQKPGALAWDASRGLLYVADPMRAVALDTNGMVVDELPVLAGASSLAIDAGHEALWAAEANGATLVRVPFDAARPQELVAVPVPFQVGSFVAIVDGMLWAIDPAGHLATVDLSVTPPVARNAGALALMGAVTAAGTDGEWLYVADASARLWRVDPHDAIPSAELLAGDGAHGVQIGAVPGLNVVGGIAHDPDHGFLLLTDTAENTVLSLE
jgi:hypothetical protein